MSSNEHQRHLSLRGIMTTSTLLELISHYCLSHKGHEDSVWHKDSYVLPVSQITTSVEAENLEFIAANLAWDIKGDPIGCSIPFERSSRLLPFMMYTYICNVKIPFWASRDDELIANWRILPYSITQMLVLDYGGAPVNEVNGLRVL